MRLSLVLLTLAMLLVPARAEKQSPVKSVSVQQLEAALASSRDVADDRLAEQLSYLELTERISASRQARLDTALPGPASRRALTTLADAAEFLDLPAADILSTPMPNHARQTAMLVMTRDYVVKTILKLPNFFATRDTTNFERAPDKSVGPSANADQHFPLQPVSRSTVTVLYRDNRELVAKGKGRDAYTKQMRTQGEFGPILATVVHDAAKGRVTWSHWEQGASGPMAVYQYVIPKEQSHYMVSYVEVAHGSGNDPAYHGEIGVDPVDGSILRMTVIADTRPDNPITSANLLVDYGPVEIGGVSYVCPVKSIAFSRVRMVVQELNFSTGAVEGSSLGQAKTYLNEVLFKDYHRFRAETRILSGDAAEPDASAPAN